MKYIKFSNDKCANSIFDMGKLLKMMEQIPDNRKAKGKQYPLPFLLGCILLARLAGEHTPSGITEWIRLRRRYLVEVLPTLPATPIIFGLNLIKTILASTVSIKIIIFFIISFILSVWFNLIVIY